MNFTEREKDFLNEQQVARLATVSEKGWPQITPVIFAFDGKDFYIAIDYGSKKLENIKKNNKVGLTIDVFARQPKSIIMQGFADIFERGEEFKHGYKILYDKFAYYRANPFKEGESPILRIRPLRKKNAGLR